MTIASWYEELDRQLSNSQVPLVDVLNQRYAQPWAIPFFGRLAEARVLTVGLNPAYSEFNNSRWSSITSAVHAVDRLVNYFQNSTPPHRWFDTWEAALNNIDASYYGKHRYLAAHVDVWPRATNSPSEFPEEQLLECMAADLGCFVSAIGFAPNATIILMAGSVTGDFHLNQFLKTYLSKDEGELEGSFNPFAQQGPGKTVVHRLRIGSRKLPVFFCSTSPSDEENRDVLVQRVLEYSIPIKRLGGL